MTKATASESEGRVDEGRTADVDALGNDERSDVPGNDELTAPRFQDPSRNPNRRKAEDSLNMSL